MEGNLCELYDEIQLYASSPSMFLCPVPGAFQTESILKVTGKVLVGYDMEKISVTVE